jgi:hypothetical protein
LVARQSDLRLDLDRSSHLEAVQFAATEQGTFFFFLGRQHKCASAASASRTKEVAPSVSGFRHLRHEDPGIASARTDLRGIWETPGSAAPSWSPRRTGTGANMRFDAVVLKALESDPSKRHAKASELKGDLERLSTKAEAASPPLPAPGAVRAPMWPLYAAGGCFGLSFLIGLARTLLIESPFGDEMTPMRWAMLGAALAGLAFAAKAAWGGGPLLLTRLTLIGGAVAVALHTPVYTFVEGVLVAAELWIAGHILLSMAGLGRAWGSSAFGWGSTLAALGLVSYTLVARAPRPQYGKSMYLDLMLCGAICLAAVLAAAGAFAVDAKRRRIEGFWLAAASLVLVAFLAPATMVKIGWTWRTDVDGAILCAACLIVGATCALVALHRQLGPPAGPVPLLALAAGGLALVAASGWRASLLAKLPAAAATLAGVAAAALGVVAPL